MFEEYGLTNIDSFGKNGSDVKLVCRWIIIQTNSLDD